MCYRVLFFFFFNDTATTEIYTLSLHDALPISPLVLRDGPQEVGGHDGARERGSIAEDDDERGQVLDLKTVVERVAKAMGPVKERQRDEDEEVESRHRVPDQAEDRLVARGVHPSDRKSTRLNSSHGYISYAVFCLKKKKNTKV